MTRHLATTSINATTSPSTIEVMRRQELTSYYQCRDYLLHAPGRPVVTEETRREMVEWVLKASLFLKFSVDIPMKTTTLLDRFLQTKQGSQLLLESVLDYRLAAMACLYLTAKVHEPTAFISAEVMSSFSHGMFSAQQVEDMEWTILQAMQWRVNPPTCLEFVRDFLDLLPCSVTTERKEAALDLCITQLNRTMLDYPVFCLTKPSAMAYFALQNALECLGTDGVLLLHISDIFCFATHTDFVQETVNESELQAVLTEAILPLKPKKLSHHSPKGRFSLHGSKTKYSNQKNKKNHLRRRTMSLDISPRGVVDRAF